MADMAEKETLATSLNKALEKSKGLVLAVAAIVVVAIVAVAVFATVRTKSIEKGIEQVDLISYNLTNESKDLSESDIASRQGKALEELAPLSEKAGVVGLRANMLIAEIKFSQKNYDDARAAWLKAVKDIAPRQVMIYTIDRETPAHNLLKATHEELDRIVELLKAEGIYATASY